MEEDRDHSELERQLREAAEGLRMEPSDRVWTGINEQLHPRRRRYLWWASAAAALAVLLALGLYLEQRPAQQSALQHEKAEGQIPSAVASGSGQQKQTEKVSSPTAAHPGGIAAERSSPTPAQSAMPARTRDLTPVALALVPQQIAVGLALPELSGPAVAADSVVLSETVPDNPTPGPAHLLAAEQSTTAALVVPTPAPPHSKLSFSLFFTPSSGYRVLRKTPVANPSLNPAAPVNPPPNRPSLSAAAPPVEKKGPSHHPSFSWVVGIRAGLSLGSHGYVQSGISLQQADYEVLTYGTYPGYTVSGPARRTNTFLATNAIPSAAWQRGVYRKNHYLQAEVPLLAGWRFGNPDRIHVSVAAGAGISYVLHSDPLIYSPKSDHYLTDKSLIRPVNGLLHLETAVQVPLGRQTAISLGPSVQYQLLSSYRNFGEVREHPYLIGIAAGIHWRR